VIAPRTGIRSVPMEGVIASLEKLYADGLIVSVRVVQPRGDSQGPIAFFARLTSAGRASLANG